VRVSVLLTSFEHERYIAQALDGVLAQEGVEFELLAGDDASTDGTREVLARYAREHPGVIRTFFPEQNMGNGGKAIFAALIGQARGDYLAVLDADDYWTAPDKLRRQVAYLDEHPEAAMCFHDVLCVYEDDDRPDARYNGPGRPAEVTMPELLDRCVVASCTPLFRRDAIMPLPAWYFDLPWGDWSLYFLAARHGTLRYLDEPMGVYRIHRGGMYSGLARLEALEQRTAFYEGLRVAPEHDRGRRRKLAESWVKRALEHNRILQRREALGCLAKAARAWPPIVLSAPSAVLRRLRGRAETSRPALR
jgi:glycosyltransferase involved in cell wall biosynthesis